MNRLKINVVTLKKMNTLFAIVFVLKIVVIYSFSLTMRI